jgi:hypothetical protein
MRVTVVSVVRNVCVQMLCLPPIDGDPLNLQIMTDWHMIRRPYGRNATVLFAALETSDGCA